MSQVQHAGGLDDYPIASRTPLRLSGKSPADEAVAGAMFVIDGQRRILFGNDRALEMLRSTAIVYACGNRISFLDGSQDAAFAHHLSHIARGRVREVRQSLQATGGQRYAVSLIAMTSPTPPDGGMQPQPYALTIRSETQASPPFAAIAEDHALTPAESRVLGLVCRGLNAVEIAQVLGIAASTVRTHLHRLFQKTETTRQSELVHFVATYGPHSPLEAWCAPG